MVFIFIFFFYIPQPAEYGAEGAFSRRCPDAGVGGELVLGIGCWLGGRESLAMQFPMGPSADPDSVLQMVGTVCHLGLRAQVSSLGRTP